MSDREITREAVIKAFEGYLAQRVYINHPHPDVIRAAVEMLKEPEAPDRGKIRAGLRACRVWGQTEDECLGAGCPYLTEATTDDDESWQRCLEKLHRDAEEALDRQTAKPVRIKQYPYDIYACGDCGHKAVGSDMYRGKYCPECGKRLVWDDE